MTELQWDQDAQRLYETGTSHGVLYVKKDDGTYDTGVPWNGLTSVSESPSGAEETPLYANNHKYLSLRSAEEFAATLEAYTYPDEWEECDGSAALDSSGGITIGQQVRRGFGLSYRTIVGNDTQGDKYGYKIHLIYNAMASPSEKSYATVNDSPEAITLSWEMTTTPIEFKKDLRPSATLVIDSTKMVSENDRAILKSIENMLYGTEDADPKLPTPAEIIALLNAADGGTEEPGTEG